MFLHPCFLPTENSNGMSFSKIVLIFLFNKNYQKVVTAGSETLHLLPVWGLVAQSERSKDRVWSEPEIQHFLRTVRAVNLESQGRTQRICPGMRQQPTPHPASAWKSAAHMLRRHLFQRALERQGTWLFLGEGEGACSSTGSGSCSKVGTCVFTGRHCLVMQTHIYCCERAHTSSQQQECLVAPIGMRQPQQVD